MKPAKMAYLRRPSKNKDTVGWFKPDGRCKKHPKHRQSPGVCSLCLTEKLTKLSSRKSKIIISAATAGYSTDSSSASSYYSSSSASSCASPIHRFRFTTEGKSSSSLSIFFLSGKHGLVRSRSMAVVPRKRDGEGGVDHGHNRSTKNGGCWFKLLHPKSNRSMEEGTYHEPVHSMSVSETLTVAS